MYYAIFKTTPEGVEVQFPDLPNGFTFGETIPEAVDMAIDVLSALLATGKRGIDFHEPSSLEVITEQATTGDFVFPIKEDQKIMDSYAPKERINISMDKALIALIDEDRAKDKKQRSSWLAEAARKTRTPPR